MSPWLENHRTVTFQAQTARLSTEVRKTLISKNPGGCLTQLTDIRLPLEGTSSRWIFLQRMTVIHLIQHYMHLSKWRHKYHWGTGNYITQKTFLSLRLSGTLTLAFPPKTKYATAFTIEEHMTTLARMPATAHQLEWLPVRSMQRWVRTWYSIVQS